MELVVVALAAGAALGLALALLIILVGRPKLSNGSLSLDREERFTLPPEGTVAID